MKFSRSLSLSSSEEFICFKDYMQVLEQLNSWRLETKLKRQGWEDLEMCRGGMLKMELEAGGKEQDHREVVKEDIQRVGVIEKYAQDRVIERWEEDLSAVQICARLKSTNITKETQKCEVCQKGMSL